MAVKEWVFIEHPDVKGDPARVTREAYDITWKPKGWKLASKKAVEAAKEG